jgi:hypothetical protein
MNKHIEIFRERLQEELSSYKQGNNSKCPIINEIKVQIMLAGKEITDENIASLATQISNINGVAQMFIKMTYQPKLKKETYLIYKNKKYQGNFQAIGGTKKITDTTKLKFYELFVDLGWDFIQNTNIKDYMFTSKEAGNEKYGDGVGIDQITDNWFTNFRPYGFSGQNKTGTEEKLVKRLNKYLGKDKITHYIPENGTLIFPTWAKLEDIDL